MVSSPSFLVVFKLSGVPGAQWVQKFQLTFEEGVHGSSIEKTMCVENRGSF